MVKVAGKWEALTTRMPFQYPVAKLRATWQIWERSNG